MGTTDKASVVIVPESKDANIARITEGQDRPFPSASEIELWERPSDPFKIPSWCKPLEFEYAWIHASDPFRPLDVALEDGYWNIVKRINHPSAPSEAFRSHGAVERGEQILVYRPKDLGDRLRELPALRQAEIAGTRKADVRGAGYDLTYAEGRDAGSDGEVMAYEPAGAATDSEKAKDTIVAVPKG